MTDKLSRAVGEALADIPEDFCDASAEIQALLSQHKAARLTWQSAIKRFDEARSAAAGLAARIDTIKTELRSIEAKRPAILAEAVLSGGASFTEDDKLIEQVRLLRLDCERLELARPEIDSRIEMLNRRVGQAANPAVSIEDQLRDARYRLRVAEARRRCGF